MLEFFKAGWILIACQCFYQLEKKNITKVIPTIWFACANIVIVVV